MSVDFKFYAITNRQMIGVEAMLERIDDGFRNGLKAVQIREKDLPAGQLCDLTTEIKRSADLYGAKVFINDRIDIALALQLDGVHLPETGLPVRTARKLLGEKAFIGVSAHDARRVQQAASEGADFCVAGPLQASRSKEPGHWIMPERVFRDLCRQSTIPVFALGGIRRDDIPRWIEAGAYGIAGISLWLNETRDIFSSIRETLGSL